VSRGWKVTLIVGGALAVLYAAFLGVLLYAGGDGGGLGSLGSSGTVGVLRLDGVVSAGPPRLCGMPTPTRASTPSFCA
jgi:hypothetical protein